MKNVPKTIIRIIIGGMEKSRSLFKNVFIYVKIGSK